MNKIIFLLAVFLLAAACDREAYVDGGPTTPDVELSGNRGQVISTIRVPRYTYIEVRSNGALVWLAGPPVELLEGDIITWGDFAVMRDFKSRELDRTFAELLFVAAVQKEQT